MVLKRELSAKLLKLKSTTLSCWTVAIHSVLQQRKGRLASNAQDHTFVIPVNDSSPTH